MNYQTDNAKELTQKAVENTARNILLLKRLGSIMR